MPSTDPLIHEMSFGGSARPARRIRPVGVGLIGLGRAGCWHLERLRLRDDFDVVGACDDCVEASRRTVGLAPRIVDHREQLLRDPAVELVLVATPPATHAALAIEALASGKDVLLETPLALNVFEVDALLDAEQRSGRSVIVAQNRRWDADFRTARECLASGAIGGPREIKFVHWQYSLGRPGDLTDGPEAGADGLPRHSGSRWRDYVASGGGALWEFGVHLFDQLLLLADATPVSVFARVQAPKADEVDTGFLALVRFASGLEAQIEVNRGVAAPLDTGWVISAIRGSYARETQYTLTDEGEIVDVPLSLPVAAADDFHSAVVRFLREGVANPVPARAARPTIALIEAARQSARSGLPVAVGG